MTSRVMRSSIVYINSTFGKSTAKQHFLSEANKKCGKTTLLKKVWQNSKV